MFFFNLHFCWISSYRDDDEDEEIPQYFSQIDYNPLAQLFVAQERVWRDDGEIVTEQPNVVPYSIPPKLNWGQLLADTNITTEYDYFRLLFPFRFMIDIIVPLTNSKLLMLQQSPLLPPEFLQFLGITLSMALTPVRGGLDAYWSVTNDVHELGA